MLSILIPVYQWDVRALVRTLHAQATALGIKFECLVYDDASPDDSFNSWKILNELNGVRVLRMPTNLGRAQLRNRLATDAGSEWLLFLDADAVVPDDRFIARYWTARETAPVLCGGTAYAENAPTETAKYLRWHFGRHREQRSAAVRSEVPYASFSTFNFLIQRSIFQSIGFDAQLARYGHEDTLFGWELERWGIPIHHLDNPLLHLGLDGAAQFLAKTEAGIRNLLFLRKRYPQFSTRLLDADKQLGPLGSLLPPLRFMLERRLRHGRPALWIFDLWKLAVLRKMNKY